MEKISYEHRANESVDDRTISWTTSQELMGKSSCAVMGKYHVNLSFERKIYRDTKNKFSLVSSKIPRL